MPKISVIIPVYNAEEFLAQALDSVLNQTFSDWELILVNDGSVDKSTDIMENYCQRDNRIHISSKENEGPAKARMQGIKRSQGDYIFMMDADDLISLDLLQKMHDKAVAGQADVVIPDMEIFFGNKKRFSFFKKYKIDTKKILSSQEAFQLTFPWRIHSQNLWKSDLIKTFYTDENVPFKTFNKDEYLTRLLFLNAKKIMFSEGVYYYKNNPNSLTKQIKTSTFEEVITNHYLILLAKQYQLPKSIQNEVVWDAVSKLMYLERLFFKTQKNFSDSEQQEILKIFRQAHQELVLEEVVSPKGLKNKIKAKGFSDNNAVFEKRMKFLSYLL